MIKLLFDQKIGRLLHAITGVAATIYIAFHLLPLGFLKPDPMSKALAPGWVRYYPMVLALGGVLLVVAAVSALRKAYRDVRDDMPGGNDTPTEAASAAADRAAKPRQASGSPAPKGFGRRV